MKLAESYREWRDGGRVAEEPPAPVLVGRPVPEIELQARWFGEEFGREFVSTAGEPVSIVSFGAWNREAGCNFSQALVSIANRPPVQGGIEITSHADDWARRATDPDYNDTVLHCFAAVKADTPRRVTTACGREVARIVLDSNRFEFPRGEVAGGPLDCGAPLAGVPRQTVVRLLEAAAQFRLCRKAARLRRHADPEEALYRALAETLGYRNNKLPFTVLAQRFPLSTIRSGDTIAPEPLLFGGAGFLNATDLATVPGDTRGYLRDLWADWWPRRSEWERLVLPLKLWVSSGVRPVNHPQRRLAALAAIVRNWPVICTLARHCDVTAICGFFSLLSHEYWDFHYTLTSSRAATRMALVGESRVTDMLANVFFPAAIDTAPNFWEAYKELAAPSSNQRVDEAARRLMGNELPLRKLLKRAVYQQGLLQLWEDHCASCTGCRDCPLREKLLHAP